MGNVFHHTTMLETDNEILEETEVVESHFHNYERWFGSTAGVGPGSQTSLTPYRVTSLNVANSFGTAITVFNGTETPTRAAMTKFDFHKIYVVDAENTNKTYRLRFADNHAGHASWAMAVSAGYFSDVCFRLTTNTNRPSPVEMKYPRLPVGTVVWVAVATLDAVAQWLDFLVGIHEYVR